MSFEFHVYEVRMNRASTTDVEIKIVLLRVSKYNIYQRQEEKLNCKNSTFWYLIKYDLPAAS